jgi:ferrous iron transport protein B
VTAPAVRERWVALAGNPNTGKTTLFNALTGYRAKVANYPGVTVEKKSGPFRALPGVSLLDLPGTYSLAARSPDEAVAADVLLGRRDDTARPDALVVVVDASNLERNLYLATQLFETGVPTVVALNMMDVARSRGHEIDVARLSASLGVPVVPVVASRGEGVHDLVAAVRAALDGGPPKPLVSFHDAFEREAEGLARVLEATPVGDVPAFERRRILLDVGGHAERRAVERGGAAVAAAVAAARSRLEASGTPVAGLEATLRYGALGPVARDAVRAPASPKTTATDRIDAVLTHRVLGGIAFLGVMTLVFTAIYSWAAPLMDFLSDGVFGRLGAAISSSGALGGGALESLVVDGVVGGVGGVLVFLPQIAILFAFLAILEDCGYMARAAFLMDRLLRWCGLSGKSFIPMLSSFACAVPGIMATRTIEARRDRLATILVAPLMSCSARIPVYALLVGAFVPARPVLGPVDLRALVFAGLYLLGLVVAVPVAFLLKRTLLRGEAPPFVMELPPYRLPSPRAVLQRAGGQAKAFVVRAGTLILAASVVVWALSYFPHDAETGAKRDRAVAAADAAEAASVAAAATPAEAEAARALGATARDEAEREALGEWRRRSAMGRMGKAVEPVFAPLGWDWKVACAVIASFPAREVVVGTLGVLYDLGDTDDEAALRDRVVAARWEDGPRKGEPVFDLASAMALVVFFALCMQCASTLAVMWRETGSWRWPALAFGYMTALAYAGAFVTATAVRAFT